MIEDVILLIPDTFTNKIKVIVFCEDEFTFDGGNYKITRHDYSRIQDWYGLSQNMDETCIFRFLENDYPLEHPKFRLNMTIYHKYREDYYHVLMSADKGEIQVADIGC